MQSVTVRQSFVQLGDEVLAIIGQVVPKNLQPGNLVINLQVVELRCENSTKRAQTALAESLRSNASVHAEVLLEYHLLGLINSAHLGLVDEVKVKVQLGRNHRVFLWLLKTIYKALPVHRNLVLAIFSQTLHNFCSFSDVKRNQLQLNCS